MQAKTKQKLLTYLEVLAYLLAGWSFVVLFFQAIFHELAYYRQIEFYTVVANLALAALTTLSKLSFYKKPVRTFWFDFSVLVIGLLLMFYQMKYVIFILLIRQTYYFISYLLFGLFEGRLSRILSGSPPLSLLLSFALVISLGTILLMLPAASAHQSNTPFIDSLFTATSATCVTGLSVYDIGSHFSLFGQLVILLLIQIGGLGIMTISTAFAILMGRRLNLRLENVMLKVVGGDERIDMFQLLKSIIIVTVLIEGIGSIFLYPVFAKSMSPLWAMYNSVFHSISAFCNAGISLFRDSFGSYVDNPLLNITIISLIVLGGLGFAVIIDLYRYFTKTARPRSPSLHTKIVLLFTFLMNFIGFFGIYFAENKGAIAHLDHHGRFWASLFQSITSHTAGFSTVDTGTLNPASQLMLCFLMFVGASPGSTGGGIKTTTFAVLMLSVIAMLRGRKDLSIFKRRISMMTLREATSLTTLSLSLIFIFSYLLLLTQKMNLDRIVFEVISAFGTVGLSIGVTPLLNDGGKLMLTLLMYMGRVGPLTIIYALSTRKHQAQIDYADEKIAIG